MKRIDLAKMLAVELGNYLMSVYQMDHEEIAKTGVDFMLDVDLEAERRALEAIKKYFEDDQILSEERGDVAGGSGYRWVVDPLDGTVNFKYKIPYYCSSVSVEHKGELLGAVVYSPESKELFVAERGKGALLNDEPIRVSKNSDLKTAFVSYSTSNHKDKNAVELGSRVFRSVLLNCRAIRLKGSSLLDMCSLAAGNFDGLVKVYGNYWDWAAGKLIVEEAGGKVTNFEGNKPEGVSHILASNERLHKELLEVVRV